MTCIVGLADNDVVYLGADSAGVSDYDLVVRRDRKIFRVGNALIGFTTSFRMGQLLGHKLQVPKRHLDTDLAAYMVTDFVDAVRECLKGGGFATVENGRERGGNFLVGLEGRLFEIESDFQVGERAIPFAAVGCGAPYALGHLHGSRGGKPLERVKEALETAAAFSAGVHGPFQVEVLGS